MGSRRILKYGVKTFGDIFNIFMCLGHPANPPPPPDGGSDLKKRPESLEGGAWKYLKLRNEEISMFQI